MTTKADIERLGLSPDYIEELAQAIIKELNLANPITGRADFSLRYLIEKAETLLSFLKDINSDLQKGL